MSKLVIICEVDTTEDYELDLLENNRLRHRNDNNSPTVADELGKQVAKVLSGLRYIDGKKGIDVRITTTLNESTTRRDAKQAVPVAINDVPSEKKKVGLG